MKKRYVFYVLILVVALSWQLFVFYNVEKEKITRELNINNQSTMLKDLDNQKEEMQTQINQIKENNQDLNEEYKLWQKRVSQSQDYLN